MIRAIHVPRYCSVIRYKIPLKIISSIRARRMNRIMGLKITLTGFSRDNLSQYQFQDPFIDQGGYCYEKGNSYNHAGQGKVKDFQQDGLRRRWHLEMFAGLTQEKAMGYEQTGIIWQELKSCFWGN